MQGAITLATTLGKGSKVRCHRSTLNQSDDFKKVVADANITPAYLESPDRLQVEILVAMDRWNARPAWLPSFVHHARGVLRVISVRHARLFDLKQTLRGRSAELRSLDEFIADPASIVGIVTGRSA